MTPAVGYMRCSGLGQVDGDTWARQEQTIRDYAALHDIEIVAWFRDEGITGKLELEQRPGLAACLERVENNGVHLVLVEVADRLARDSMVAELIIRQFQKAKCQVISASGGVDLTAGDDSNPTAKLVRQVLAAVAEFDRCVIVLKTRAARERIRKSGKKCEGRSCFGTRPDELPALHRMLALDRLGYNAADIADILSREGLLSRYGKRWNSGTIYKLLTRQRTAPESLHTERNTP
jgi:DNA invertase Pin-like site-specific DNA recombinase